MDMINYIYYCIYRFVLKTPARSDAEAWAGVFLALTAIIHAITFYFLFTLLTDKQMAPPAQLKLGGVAAMFLLIGVSFWHYVFRGNGPKVIKAFEKQRTDANYARTGAIMFAETLLLPLALSFLLTFLAKP
jgi:H+/Cl- antiporter ClcA